MATAQPNQYVSIQRRQLPSNDIAKSKFQIKEDLQAAATSVYVILRVVDNLKTLLVPILPHTAQRLHEYLGYDGRLFGTQ